MSEEWGVIWDQGRGETGSRPWFVENWTFQLKPLPTLYSALPVFDAFEPDDLSERALALRWPIFFSISAIFLIISEARASFETG
jgi:hypothetical protein